jgi:MOSC domain-containing protein YiiM
MKVISVNVGLPREVAWQDMNVKTAIFKEPVDGPIAIGKLNLAGDQQADLTVHGGSDKAVYAYPAEHYDYWRNELPGLPLVWGAFGENLTTQGLQEDSLFIGDQLRIGSAVLRVTQPRMPCYKLALKFGRENIIERFLVSGRSGFYLNVVETGEVTAGARIQVLERDPNRVTVSNLLLLYLGKTSDRELFERALAVTVLPQNWRAQLLLRLKLPSE